MNKIITLFAAVLLMSFSVEAEAVMLFQEDFNRGRFTFSFASADNSWNKARFEPGSGRLRFDAGRDSLLNPGRDRYGWFRDDAGIISGPIDVSEHTNLKLSFDWRTFLYDTSDRFTAAIFAGTPTETKATFFKDLPIGVTYSEIFRGSESNRWSSESIELFDTNTIYLAFWSDGGRNDFGLVDDIVLEGDAVAEPATLALLSFGLAGVGLSKRRKK